MRPELGDDNSLPLLVPPRTAPLRLSSPRFGHLLFGLAGELALELLAPPRRLLLEQVSQIRHLATEPFTRCRTNFRA